MLDIGHQTRKEHTLAAPVLGTNHCVSHCKNKLVVYVKTLTGNSDFSIQLSD